MSDVVAVLSSETEIIAVLEVGPIGPRGLAPSIPRYTLEQISPVDGVLTIDVSVAATVHVLLDADVTSIVFTGWPEDDQSQRFVVYFQQDENGGHAVTGWPANILWPSGVIPTLTVSQNAIDSLVFDTFDGGTTILGTPAAFDYGPAS